MRAMTAASANINIEAIKRRHDFIIMHRRFAKRQIRPIVHAEYRIDRELLKQSFRNHASAAALVFFGRLKNKHGGAGKISVFA